MASIPFESLRSRRIVATVSGVLASLTFGGAAAFAQTSTVVSTTAPASSSTAVSSTVVSSTVVSSSTPAPTTIGSSTTNGASSTPPTTGVTAGLAPIAPTTTAFVPGPVLKQGSRGAAVEAMKRKLDLLRFDVGEVNDRFDAQTWQGLMAFQKLHGLKRTGKFDVATQEELSTASIPGGLIPNGGLPRVEVDISRQVMMYFDQYGLNRVIAVSTGSNKKYCATSKKTGRPNCGDARTPRGNYRIERRIKGVRESDLGTLYSPMYFTGGYAIHGSPSIPAYNASHGCVRITNHTADWMFENVKNGTPVYVFD